MTDLDARAAAIFGTSDSGVLWPYDVSGIDRTLRTRDPERFERDLAVLTAKKLVLVNWAEQHGLKRSSVRCCPWWLTRERSRRCNGDQCTNSPGNPDSVWLDHPIFWLKGGKPAAITSAAYHFEAEHRARADWWLSQNPHLRLAQGSGWYGRNTQQLILWRADRIESVTPAELPDSGDPSQ